jgi:hypothetical protein
MENVDYCQYLSQRIDGDVGAPGDVQVGESLGVGSNFIEPQVRDLVAPGEPERSQRKTRPRDGRHGDIGNLVLIIIQQIISIIIIIINNIQNTTQELEKVPLCTTRY